jgi:hypothetical protein
MATAVAFPTLASELNPEQFVLLNQRKHGEARFRDFCEYAWFASVAGWPRAKVAAALIV